MSPRLHWPEYLGEAALLGAFMLVACVTGVALDHPAAAAVQAIPDAFTRRALFGLVMGATAVALIYSPLGKRTGAHLNPSVTFIFQLPACSASNVPSSTSGRIGT